MNAKARKHARPRQESSDLNMRAVVLGALGVIATVLLVAGAARLLTGASGLARAGPTETSIARPTELESDPFDPRFAFDEEKRAQLDSYGWVDRERGVARVPIERAMQIKAADDAAKGHP
jgi:hypothetical protein